MPSALKHCGLAILAGGRSFEALLGGIAEMAQTRTRV
jgi:hypothetical protein